MSSHAPADLDTIQHEVGDYVDRTWPGEDVMQAALGLCEEVGELARAFVKRNHGTRGSYDEWTAEIRKCGDVAIVLCDLARREGFSLADAIADRWTEVEGRDPNHDPIGGELLPRQDYHGGAAPASSPGCPG